MFNDCGCGGCDSCCDSCCCCGCCCCVSVSDDMVFDDTFEIFSLVEGLVGNFSSSSNFTNSSSFDSFVETLVGTDSTLIGAGSS